MRGLTQSCTTFLFLGPAIIKIQRIKELMGGTIKKKKESRTGLNSLRMHNSKNWWLRHACAQLLSQLMADNGPAGPLPLTGRTNSFHFHFFVGRIHRIEWNSPLTRAGPQKENEIRNLYVLTFYILLHDHQSTDCDWWNHEKKESESPDNPKSLFH